MVFTNVFNPRSQIPRINELLPTLVRKGATLGANSTIICGNTIGAYSFIGAGAVVAEDVPDHAFIIGNPGIMAGWMCKCCKRLKFEDSKTACEACGLTYKLTNGEIRIIFTEESQKNLANPIDPAE